MKLLKIPGKIALTLVYPIARIILAPLDQLSGRNTGFFEGIKYIWKGKKEGEQK